MQNKSLIEELTVTLQRRARVVREGAYLIEASNRHSLDDRFATNQLRVGIVVKQVKETELPTMHSKKAISTLIHDLIKQHESSLADINIFHVFFIPLTGNTLVLAQVIRKNNWKEIIIKIRRKHLQLLPRTLHKKLKKCLKNPTNVQFWDNLHDSTDEMEELIQVMNKFQHQLVNSLKRYDICKDEDHAWTIAKYWILQLVITWYLYYMGVLEEKERQLLSHLLMHDSQMMAPTSYHEGALKLLEHVHLRFQGKMTINENSLALMRQVIIPNHFYHQETLSLEGALQNVNWSPQALPKLGLLDLLQLIDWDALNDQFYFLGTLLEQLMRRDTRKKTGTYYTPPHVTEYMVSAVINCFLLDKINDKFNKTFSTVNDAINQGTRDLMKFLRDLLLNIKILDPAMGSGHFLEAALNYLVELHESILDNLDGDVKSSFVQDVLLTKLKTVKNPRFPARAIIARHVILENLHGTDTNSDAIQIAKIRLTLKLLNYLRQNKEILMPTDVMEVITALKFNLKVGNSLVGVHSMSFLMSLINDTKQMDSLLKLKIDQLSKFLPELSLIVHQEPLTPSIVTSEDLDVPNDSDKLVFKQWFVMWLVILDKINYGLKKTRAFNKQGYGFDQLRAIQHRIKSQLHQVLTRLMEIAVNVENLEITRPLHWLIEFPELFHEKQQNGTSGNLGFDIILGNPPYIRQEEIGIARHDFPYKTLLTRLYTPSDNKYDYSLYFVLRSLQLLKNGGWNAFIITDKWLRTIYGKSFRQLLKSRHSLQHVVDVSNVNLFPRARVACLIYFLKKTTPNEDHHFTFEQHQLRSLSVPSRTYRIKQALLPDERPWTFLSSELQEIADWIFTVGTPLKELRAMIYYGIKTGYNKAFLIPTAVRNKLVSKNPKNAEIIVPVIMGRCINRYHLTWNQRWLILSKSGLNLATRYPDVLEWLKQFEPQLKKRTDQGQYWFNLRPCRYYDEFKKPKIMWKEITMRPSFFYDSSGLLTDATAFILTGPDATKSLVAVLNSPISWIAIQQLGTTLAPTTLRYKREYTFNLPIRLPPKKEEFAFNSLVDAVQFLKATTTSAKLTRQRQEIQFLERLLDVLIFELYFEEKLETIPNYTAGVFRSLVGDACKNVTLDVDHWFTLYWKTQITNDYWNKEEYLLLKHLSHHNSREISLLIHFLKEDENVQSLYQMLQQHEWYMKLLATMPRNAAPITIKRTRTKRARTTSRKC